MTPWACTQGNKHIPLGIKDLQLYMHLKHQHEHGTCVKCTPDIQSVNCFSVLQIIYYSAVVWPHKNWGMVWHLWQIHNSCPPNLWEQEILWREHYYYNGAYLPADSNWAPHADAFQSSLENVPMRWTSCCTTLYSWIPIWICSSTHIICQCILRPTKLQMQLRVITYQHLYLKGSMDIWEDPTEGVCQPWGSMAFVLWKPYRSKAPPVKHSMAEVTVSN